ncbi:hypothetical protein GCM10010404_19410 [Nonomuraea africana]|uniref:DUF4352 domain-containing protein n=1 Tax=Nonomuraea africana TaxID=46171 RepID=A0ABR9KT40_9ACTN|nr:hypothetical protein [Nonomuraea africana]MBE1565202.1 hypothetical protein [Nonomuraea africana]
MTEPSSGDNRPPRPVLVPAVGLVLATGIGITALLGGLNDAPDPNPPALKVAAEIDQGQFKTQFVEGRVTVVKPDTTFGDPKRFLELEVKVTNTGEETADSGSAFASTLLKITPEIKPKSGVISIVPTQSGPSRQLQPGIPTKVLVRYELEAGVKPPEKVTIDVGKREYLKGDFTPASGWVTANEEKDEKQVPVVLGQITIPVKQGEGA